MPERLLVGPVELRSQVVRLSPSLRAAPATLRVGVATLGGSS